MTKPTIVILLLSCLAMISCSRGRMVSRPLTEEEMQIPPGRSESGIDLYHTSAIDLPSFPEEPVLEWTYESNWDARNLLLDGEDGMWFATGDPSGCYSSNTVARLDPYGNVDWERALLPPGTSADTTLSEIADKGITWSMVDPLIACSGAVICSCSRSREKEPDSHVVLDSYLECVDIDGETRWRTEHIDRWFHYTSRIDAESLTIVNGANSFGIYSISTGERLHEYEFDRNLPDLTFPQVMSVADSWICFLKDPADNYSVCRYSSSMNLEWEHSLGESGRIEAYALDENALLVNTTLPFRRTTRLLKLDLTDGSVLWDRLDKALVSGVTPDGGCFLSRGEVRENVNVALIGPEGSELWSLELNTHSYPGRAPVMFNDNSILIGYRWGISQLNPDGTIRWTIDLDDMGVADRSMYREGFESWELAPTSDGGLVAAGSMNTHPADYTTIFKFAPAS